MTNLNETYIEIVTESEDEYCAECGENKATEICDGCGDELCGECSTEFDNGVFCKSCHRKEVERRREYENDYDMGSDNKGNDHHDRD